MAIAYISGSAANGGGGGNNTASVTTDSTGADLIVVAVSGYATDGVTDVSDDTYSNAMSDLTQVSGVGASNSRLWYCLAPTVGSGHTFTYTESGCYPRISVACYSGVLSFDAESAGGSSSGSTIQPGSLTPAEDGSLLLTHVCCGSNDTIDSIDSSFNIRTTHNYDYSDLGNSIADLIQATAAAVNPTWTMSGTASLGASMAAFSPSGGAPATTRRYSLTLSGVG